MRKFAFTAFIFFCSFISFSQNKPPITTIKQLTESIREIMQREHITGLMFGITTKDSVIFSGGLGYADVATHRMVDSNTLFRMGSVTKMFVSLGILQLVREGKFRLTDELKKIAPEIPFTNKWETGHPVRVINLLEHTAGFDDMKLNKLYSAGNFEIKGLDRVIAQKHSLVCRWKPGERFAYSNPNYAILGYLIEKYSGKNYDEYLADLILRPLGMTHSNFNFTGKLPAQETKEYYFQHGRTSEAPSVNMLIGPAGALWSSAGDMLKFIRMFLNNGDALFSDSLFHVMEIPQSSLGAKAGLNTCYALANRPAFIDARFSYRGHDGLAGTCFSTCNYNRELGIGFVIASNSNNDMNAIRRLVVQFIEQNIVTGKNEQQLGIQPVNVKEMQPWLGRYQFESPRNEIAAFKDKLLEAPEFYIEDGKLFLKALLGNTYELVQTAPLTFAWKGNNAPLIVFTKNDEGNEVMILAGSYFEKVPATWAMAKRIGVVIVILFAILSYILAMVTAIGFLMKRVTGKDAVIRILPCIGVTLLIITTIKMLEVQTYSFKLSELASVNARSLTVFIGSSIFAIITLLTIFFAVKHFRQTKKRWFAVYFLLTALSLVVIAAILWQAGWIGLRTWTM